MEEGEGAGFVEDAADLDERDTQLRKEEGLCVLNCMCSIGNSTKVNI